MVDIASHPAVLKVGRNQKLFFRNQKILFLAIFFESGKTEKNCLRPGFLKVGEPEFFFLAVCRAETRTLIGGRHNYRYQELSAGR